MFSIAFDFLMGILLTVLAGANAIIVHPTSWGNALLELLSLSFALLCFARAFYHLIWEIRKP